MYARRKGKKEKKEIIDMQSQIEIEEEDLYTLKITCKGGKNSRKGKGINVEKI